MAEEQDKNMVSGYMYIKTWFAFAFENQTQVRPAHGALYVWLVELNNRLGWAKEYSSPASQSMAACGITSYNTYKKAFDDLVEWGFVKLIEPAVNQYTACKIALLKNNKAQYRALDRALKYHNTEHCSSTTQSTDSINKLRNLETKKLRNTNPLPGAFDSIFSFDAFWSAYDKKNDRAACLLKWSKLSQGEIQKIKEALPGYIRDTPDVKFRKNPLTWLNRRCWEDERGSGGTGAGSRKVIMQQVPFGGEVTWAEEYYESVKATTEHKFLRYE
jgi:hypothetical protein